MTQKGYPGRRRLLSVVLVGFTIVMVSLVVSPRFAMAYEDSGTFGNGCSWSYESDDWRNNTLAIYPTDGLSGTMSKVSDITDSNDNLAVEEIVVEEGVKAPKDSSGLFAGLSNLREIDATHLDTSEVTNMSNMFDGCNNLDTFTFGSDSGKPTFSFKGAGQTPLCYLPSPSSTGIWQADWSPNYKAYSSTDLAWNDGAAREKWHWQKLPWPFYMYQDWLRRPLDHTITDGVMSFNGMPSSDVWYRLQSDVQGEVEVRWSGDWTWDKQGNLALGDNIYTKRPIPSAIYQTSLSRDDADYRNSISGRDYYSRVDYIRGSQSTDGKCGTGILVSDPGGRSNDIVVALDPPSAGTVTKVEDNTPAWINYVITVNAPATLKISVPGRKELTDLDHDTYHLGDVLWLVDRGISTGYGDGTFRPLETVKRCDMAAFLYRLAGSPDFNPRTAVRTFSDVDENTPHYKEVMWLASTGISQGWGNGDGTYSFRPYADVARCDMAAFLQRLYAQCGTGAAKTDLSGVHFSDVSSATPHEDEVLWLAANGISTGYDDGTFRNYQSVARCDMAAFMCRMVKGGLMRDPAA